MNAECQWVVFMSHVSFQIISLVGPKVVAGLGGLVVAHVLIGHGETVGNVLHEAVDTVGGRNRGDVDAQFGALAVADDDLLAPVA